MVGRDAKTYQRANNVGVTKILCQILRCLVDFALFGQHFWQFCVFYAGHLANLCYFMALFALFLVFWAINAVLSRIKFCRNLGTFLGKIILAPNLLV